MAAREQIAELVVTTGLDSSGFRQGMQDMNRQMAVVRSQFRAASSELGSFGSETERLQLQANRLNAMMEVQQRRIDALASQYRATAEATGEDSRQTQNLQIQLNNARAAFSNMSNELRTVNESLHENASAANTTEGATSRFGNTMLQVGNIIKGNLITGAIYTAMNAITTGFKNATMAGIQFDESMQDAQVGFSTMLGSASKAKDMLNQLANFAQTTPFDLTGVEDSAKQMLAMGFSAKEILPDMKAIGDAAAGLGLSTDGIQRITLALGQLRTHGVADAGDLLQLTEAGIPAWNILSEAMGKPVPVLQKMVSKGLIPAQKATDILISGIEKRFPNMLGKMNNTFSAQIGNLGDSFRRLMGDVVKPEFNYLASNVFPALSNAFDNMRKKIQSGGSPFEGLLPKSVSDGFSMFVYGIKNAVDAIKSAFSGSGSNIKSFFEPILKVAASGVGKALFNIGSGISAITRYLTGDKGGFDSIMNAIKIPPNVQTTIKNVLDLLTQAYSIVAPAFKKVFQQIVTFFKDNWPEISKAVSNVMNFIVNAFNLAWPLIKLLVIDTLKTIVNGIESAVNVIEGIIKLFSDVFTGNWSGVWADIKKITTNALSLLWDIFSFTIGGKILDVLKIFKPMAGDLFKGALDALGSLASKALGALKDLFGKIFSWIYSNTIGRMTSLVDGVGSWLSRMGSKITSGLNSIKNFFSSIFSSIYSNTIGRITSLVNNSGNFIGGMVRKISSLLGGLGGIASRVFTAFKNAALGPIEQLGSRIMGRFNSIVSGIRGFGSGLYNAGRSIFNSFVKAIESIHIPLPHFQLEGKFSLKPPSIPHVGVSWFANGAIVDRPTPAIFGEDGPEAAIPLSGDQKMAPFADAIAKRIGHGGNITINNNQSTATPQTIMRALKMQEMLYGG